MIYKKAKIYYISTIYKTAINSDMVITSNIAIPFNSTNNYDMITYYKLGIIYNTM